MSWKTPLLMLRDTFYATLADNVPMLSAGIAFYTLVSFAPILVIAVAIAGAVFGPEAAQGEVFLQLRTVMGDDAAAAVQQLVLRTSRLGSNVLATLLSVALLLLGSARLFGALRFSLNTIWGVQVRSDWGLRGMLKDRLVVFLMVLATGLLLLLSLVTSAMVAALTTFFADWVPGGAVVWRSVDVIVNFGLTVIVFVLVLQFVPDVMLAWRDVFIGALITAVLFAVGRYVIGLYLGRSSVTSLYGAAGSLVAVLFWSYYSAQILCFGAEFTKLYVRRYGSKVSLRDRVVYEEPQQRRPAGRDRS